MSLRASCFTTLLFLSAGPLVSSASFASGPPIALCQPSGFTFQGNSLAVANFDGTAGPDLAGVHAKNALIALNNGAGGFGTLRIFAMGASDLVALAVADLDGDGRQDLVAVSKAPALVARLNAAGMLFGDVASTPLPSRGAGLALGDLNGDGRPDAVTTLPDSNEIAISLNDGSGVLGTPVVIAVGATFTEPVIADFNGDTHPDVLVATYAPTTAYWLLAGHGDGTFDAPVVAVAPDTYRYAIVAADFDGDGDLDLGTAGDDDVAVCWNAGDGTFSAPQVLGAGFLEIFTPAAKRIAAGDLDKDGRLDLVVGGSGLPGFDNGNNYLAVFPNLGGGAFGNARQYRVGVFPKDVALADVDGDGWLDGIATTAGLNQQGSVSDPSHTGAAFVLRSAKEAGLTGLLEVYQPVWLPARPAAGSVPDLYGSYAGSLYRAQNLGHGLFADATVIGAGDPVLARDLDGDGDDDLLVTNQDTLSVRLNLGAGGLAAPVALPAGLHLEALADADGDGRVDLFAGDAAHRVWILPGDGAGDFGTALDTGVDVPLDGSDEWPAAARDVNGDGHADLFFAVALPVEDVGTGTERYLHRLELIVRFGNGAGGFGAPDTTEAVFTAEFVHDGGRGPIAFGDWNGDGFADVACGAANCLSGNDSWFPVFAGGANGAFSPLVSLPGGTSMCDLAAADLNGDRLDDLVRIDSPVGTTYSVTPMASDGSGGFSGQSVQMGDFPVALAVADLDGDGRRDVITKNYKIPDYTHFSYTIRRNVTPVVPTSVSSAFVTSTFADGAVHLDWYVGVAARFSGAIERRTESSGWTSLGVHTSDDDGHLRYVDRDVTAGSSYAYRLQYGNANGASTVVTSWVVVPRRELQLAGAWPNPVAGRPALAFSIPERGDVEMRLIDVAGRVVRREHFANLDPGNHRLPFGGDAPAPGFYVAQIEHAGRRLQTSVVVLK